MMKLINLILNRSHYEHHKTWRRAALAAFPAAVVASSLASPGVAYAAPVSRYAAATGSGSTCTQAAPCTLATAFSKSAAGNTILLVTPGSTGHYVGNWTVSTHGTTATTPLTIAPAPGVSGPVLDGNNGQTPGCGTAACNSSILSLSAGVSLTVKDLTITRANTLTGSAAGGAINTGTSNTGGKVLVSGVTFSFNQAGFGGAISEGHNGNGTLVVRNSTFLGNQAQYGGAIDVGYLLGKGTATITNSTFSQNGAFDGGAMDIGDNHGGGTVTVIHSTFSQNRATDGGGIDVADQFNGGGGTLVVTASTFAGNTSSPQEGPDIANAANGSYSNGPGGKVTVAGNIFADSCFREGGTWTDNGYNVGSDTTCQHSGKSDKTNVGLPSMLGPLANNGGPTQTVKPLPGNPAIGLIPFQTTGLCPTTDQRGVASPTRSKCNSGSVQPG